MKFGTTWKRFRTGDKVSVRNGKFAGMTGKVVKVFPAKEARNYGIVRNGVPYQEIIAVKMDDGKRLTFFANDLMKGEK